MREKKKPTAKRKPTLHQEPTLHQKIVAIIRRVPEGAVATYGQIAKLADAPGSARLVIWALHSSSKKYKLPWHRVINSQGKIGIRDDRDFTRQKYLLQREGINLDERGKIDLATFLWKPRASTIRNVLKGNLEL